MIERTKNWPGKASATEITKLNGLARKAGMSPSNYLRSRLGFPVAEMGPPRGNQNAAAQPKPKRERDSKP